MSAMISKEIWEALLMREREMIEETEDARMNEIIEASNGYTARNSNVGKRFGRLVVLRDLIGAKDALCVCDCGAEKVVRLDTMKTGRAKSCGCWNRDVLISRRICSLGSTRALKSEYSSWRQMVNRCTDSENQKYKDYGERGITVCQEWLESFDVFFRYIGRKPSAEYTIERIDNNGNYEPGNVKWATPKEQANNRRSCRFYEFKGEKKNIKQWSEALSLPYQTLKSRLDNGWGIEAAIITPISTKRKAAAFYQTFKTNPQNA